MSLYFSCSQFHFSNDRRNILGKIDFRINDGEIVALMGGSGVGKTTLLKLCASLSGYKSSTVHVKKYGHYAVLFQNNILLEHKSVIENIRLPRTLSSGYEYFDERDVLELLNLNDKKLLSRFPYELSGGQQKRVAIARAFSYPNLSGFLMDEPLSGLDEPLKEDILAQIKMLLNRNNLGALFTTHDPFDAVTLADRIIFLSGSPATISYEHKPKVKREILSGNFDVEIEHEVAQVRVLQRKFRS